MRDCKRRRYPEPALPNEACFRPMRRLVPVCCRPGRAIHGGASRRCGAREPGPMVQRARKNGSRIARARTFGPRGRPGRQLNLAPMTPCLTDPPPQAEEGRAGGKGDGKRKPGVSAGLVSAVPRQRCYAASSSTTSSSAGFGPRRGPLASEASISLMASVSVMCCTAAISRESRSRAAS